MRRKTAARAHRLPDSIRTQEQLDDLLSEPTDGVVETLGKLDGDMLLLGVGGKMGASLTHMAKRASDAAGKARRVIGVSRFSDSALPAQLHAWGIETVACDLLDRDQLARLPDATNIVYMPALKFGSTENQSLTWAMNTYLPTMVCEKYRNSRIVAFSTGNVYPFVGKKTGGCVETDPPAPVGEYAMSCLGRERMFDYFSRTQGIPTALIRLNYANEPGYGTLVDLAQKVWAGQSIDVTMGYLNAIWQGDANAMTLQSFAHAGSPPFVVNLAGRTVLSVRKVCEQFARLMKKKVHLRGKEAGDALLSNAKKSYKVFGPPRVDEDRLIHWIADWIMRGGATLGKPTHFETRDGRF